MDRFRSGTTLSSSMASTVPRPLQSGHIPRGELKEKSVGSSSGKAKPQQDRASLMRRSSRSITWTMICRAPRASAVSTESVRRFRKEASVLTTSRSTTASMLCFLCLDRLWTLESSCTTPSMRTRWNPSLRSASSLSLCSPFRFSTMGASTSIRVEGGHGEDLLNHALGVAPAHLLPAPVAVLGSDARIENPEVVVDLGNRPHRGTGVRARGLLFDGDGRGKPADRFVSGFLHLADELPRVGGQGLHVPSLSLGKDGVDGEAGLPGPGHAGEDDELLLGQTQRRCS